ncbi:hypothetical protein [Aquimarina sp. 2201CG14-23]|uniref:hypothetical protein n=1 Tax=Aquimarina mycalae TaxID=3040073 RepID=UPI0024782D60|nr:hypothetical protein [Aquimarina sp. 2201CG14-23]MDH7444666.1 hypothetical protein [Aquimarina sp. 2201CG14-23]
MKQQEIHIDEKFIELKINRAYAGMSNLKVTNSGNSYAMLCNKIYSYHSNIKSYSGRRSLAASQKIFTQLIYKYKNFEYDGLRYTFNNGKWYWSPV